MISGSQANTEDNGIRFHQAKKRKLILTSTILDNNNLVDVKKCSVFENFQTNLDERSKTLKIRFSSMPLPFKEDYSKIRASFPRSKHILTHLEQCSALRDDEDGHYTLYDGDKINEKFQVISSLGEGSFGHVVKVKNVKSGKTLALKIAKNKLDSMQSSINEVNALQKIGDLDPSGKHLCVKMHEWFIFQNHVCIVLDKLSISLYDFMKIDNFQPFPMVKLRHIAYQMCYAIKFLHDNKITHTDLKPENVLFVTSQYSTKYTSKIKLGNRAIKNWDIRIIDFGSARFGDEKHLDVISTRSYRSPEVILKMGWMQPADVWSIGCILFELYTGFPLFQVDEDRKHLATMERALGKLPVEFVNSKQTSYFRDGKLIWNKKTTKGRSILRLTKPLKAFLESQTLHHVNLFDLISKMLEYLPNHRIKLGEALCHEFFNAPEIYH